jgi:dsRNA-specific ribonuclease
LTRFDRFGLSSRMSTASSTVGSSSALKRSWSRQNETVFPPLPKINGDVILEVFTHKSLRVAHVNEEYGDNERLALLGSAFLEAVVTESLFRLKPTLEADDIKASHFVFGF